MKKAENKTNKQYDYEETDNSAVLHLKGDVILTRAMYYEQDVDSSIIGKV